MSDFNNIVSRLRDFRDRRDWMQFHNPKNMAISISLEANELLEHFQWTDMDGSKEHAILAKEEIADEMADIAMYLIEMADNLGIDLLQAIEHKMDKNELRFPVDQVKGSAEKPPQAE